MLKQKIVIYLILILMGFGGGFFVHSLITHIQEDTLPNPYKTLSSSQQKLPECFLGFCPQYFSMDVDGDNNTAESVVIIPTRMTKGAGKLWVISKGKLIFESEELMQIGVKEAEDNRGFYLLYKTDIDNPISNKVKFIYKNGTFMITDNEAIEIVKNLPEVKDFLQRMAKANQKTLVEVDRREVDKIIIHVFEDHQDHTATFNWYQVDPKTWMVKRLDLSVENDKWDIIDTSGHECDNYEEIAQFEKPIPVVWETKFSGCMDSCWGAAFTRVPVDPKHPMFAGYVPDEGKRIPEKYLKEDLLLRISGKWTGVDADHVFMFNRRCVPSVDIEKIEIVK